MRSDATAALATFQAAHGRLCTLYAQAVSNGYQRPLVAAAARGEGDVFGPTLNALKRQRMRVNGAIVAAQDRGVSVRELIAVAREVRTVVESEWDMSILIQER